MTPRRNQKGFTLIEIMTTLALIAILVTIGAAGLRHFWLKRALYSSADSLTTQLRSAQEKVVSESYPIVYGVRFDPGTDDWWLVKYDPQNAGAGDDLCTTIQTNNFGTGIVIDAASFTPDSYITDFCRTKLSAPADTQFALFYPRGNATAGEVTLRQTSLGKTQTIEVQAITGRVVTQ